DELTLAHRLAAVLVAGAHEHPDVVEVLFLLPAATLDEPGDELGEGAELEGELQVPALLLGDHIEGIAAELRRHALEITPEDGAQDDLQRERAHLFFQVLRLPPAGEVLPPREELRVRAADHLGELGDDAPVEEGL